MGGYYHPPMARHCTGTSSYSYSHNDSHSHSHSHGHRSSYKPQLRPRATSIPDQGPTVGSTR